MSQSYISDHTQNIKEERGQQKIFICQYLVLFILKFIFISDHVSSVGYTRFHDMKNWGQHALERFKGRDQDFDNNTTLVGNTRYNVFFINLKMTRDNE